MRQAESSAIFRDIPMYIQTNHRALSFETAPNERSNIMKILMPCGNNFAKPPRWLAGIALLVLALPITTFAALGGDAPSVQADQVHMRATVKTIQADAYTVQEIQAPSGTVVREYVSPAGKVFAVAWHGPFLPDLHQILGASFDTFTHALQAPNGRRFVRGPVSVQQGGLVVFSAGHPRNFSGKAYLSDMLPEGVRAEEIR